MSKKSTIEEMNLVAQKRGGRCLSINYTDAFTELEWECNKGHRWLAKPVNIKNKKRWCPKCAGKYKTIKDMKELAASKDGLCLSGEYVNAFTKLKWKCNKGHEWCATSNAIQSGSWCPACAFKRNGEKSRLTIEEMHCLANKYGGKCLSDEYRGIDEKLWWECSKGHQWKTTPSNIRNGKMWCSTCSSNNISEKICRAYFEGIFGKKFIKVKPKWLINSNGNRMELDGYCEELGLAFEYQGEQHYKESRIFSKKRSFIQQKQDDELKRNLCLNNNVYLIEIPYTVEYKEMGNYIISKCKIFEDKIINRNVIYEKFNIYNKDSRLEELKELAKKFGGECLSDFYINSDTKIRWRCKDGHKFEAVAYSVKNHQWCPVCYRIRQRSKKLNAIIS